MSSVQTNYSTNPSNNISLGGLSMAEGQTQIRALNDAIRKLMADIREDSNEVRALIAANASSISSLSTEVTDALNSANQAAQTASNLSDALQDSLAAVSDAQAAAQTSATAVQNAEQMVDESDERLGLVEELAASNQENILSMLSRINTLELSGVAAGYVQVDGATITNAGNVLSVYDVAVGGRTGDVASARGQIGRTAVVPQIGSLDAYSQDGWYAVPSTASSIPAAGLEGILRVSTGYTSGMIMQEFFAYALQIPRVFLRASSNSGATWTAWYEIPTSFGSGLAVSNGAVTAVPMTGATGSRAGTAGIVPAPASDQANCALMGDASWKAVAFASDVATLSYNLTSLSDDLLALTSAHDILSAAAVKDSGNQTIYGTKTFVDTIVGTVQKAIKNASGEDINTTYMRADDYLTDIDVDDIFVNDELYAPLISSSAVGAALDDLSALAQEYITATAQAYFNSQLATKANTASPSLSGTPTTPTPSTGDSSTKIANTQFVQSTVASATASAVAGVVGNAPDDLNTLKELSDAIGGDPMFASTVDGKLATKITTGSSAYVKGVSVSGRNVTITFGDNSTATIQTQDTTYDPLSASDVADIFAND